MTKFEMRIPAATPVASVVAGSKGNAKQIEYTERRRQYWDDYAANFEHWAGPRTYYQQKLIDQYRFLVPRGSRVLEIGCGTGDLLAALEPGYGVGVDLSPNMIARAREKYPHSWCRTPRNWMPAARSIT
jgi:ubiquinone/menaquinone biosynthesis C-methylase UbiE